MLHIVEESPQIQIYDFGLAFHYSLGYAVNRFMSGPPRSVSIRSRLEVGFENRLQDEL